MSEVSDRLYKKAEKLNIPLAGAFELLPTCNLNCKMCYIRKDIKDVEHEGGILDGAFWNKCVDKAVAEGMIFPLLTGGEPLMHPDFFDIYTHMQKLGLCVTINTNATLIDKDCAKVFKSNRPKRLNITLYGCSEKSYGDCCGNAKAYQRVAEAVDLLKQGDVPVKFNVSITPYNVGELKEIISFAKYYKYPVQIATYMFPPVRRGGGTTQNYRLSPKEAGIAKTMADYYLLEKDAFIKNAEKYSKFVPIDEIIKSLHQKDINEKMTCRAGKCSFWIDWKGNIGSCGMYATEDISLFQYDFKEAWTKVVSNSKNTVYKSYCGGCPNKTICHSCIAMVYGECGNLSGRPEYLCEMNEAAAVRYRELLNNL